MAEPARPGAEPPAPGHPSSGSTRGSGTARLRSLAATRNRLNIIPADHCQEDKAQPAQGPAFTGTSPILPYHFGSWSEQKGAREPGLSRDTSQEEDAQGRLKGPCALGTTEFVEGGDNLFQFRFKQLANRGSFAHKR